MQLTNESIAALAASKGDEFFWDDSMAGFGVRLRNGRKSYVVQYRVGRQQRRETLGNVGKVRLADARKAAQQRFAQVELGNDPVAEKARARTASAAAALTLAKATDLHLAAKDSVRPSTYRAIRMYLTGSYWAPLADRPLAAIALPDVAARLREIAQAHGPSAAHAARSKLWGLYTWALGEGLCTANPVAFTNDPRAGARPRDRTLSSAEIRAVWRACADDGSDFGRVVRLLILTGCRREEIGGLRWDEIDGNVMTIPSSRTKNGQPLVLKLPALALATLPPRRDGRAFVFGQHGKGFSGWSYQTKCLFARVAAADGPLPHFTLHDLRRTFRTGLSRIGVPPHVAEAAINHLDSKLRRTYDLHKFETEIADALVKWADHVAAVVDREGGNNVVSLVA